ncbi:MAG: hypothetical protein OIF34_04735 [Porticoccaceae bacterium]|nr:hypothetical protein [Porticoccaceae bacterium]
MRWLLAVLLLANAVMYFWSDSRPTEMPAAVEVSANSDIAQLVLLSERAPGQVLSGDCVVVGPIADLALIETLSAGLTDRQVAHQRWSESPDGDATGRTYWLQFPVSLQSRLERRFWFNVLSQSPNTEISQKSCAAVASTGDLP